MLASCSRVAGRKCQNLFAEAAPAAASSSSSSFLQSRVQQQWRSSSLSHVKGLKRPTRASLAAQDALDMWDYSPKPVRVASPSSGTSSTLAKYNMELAKLDSYHRVSDAFEVCQKMKEEGVVPDKTTYDHLLSLCGAHLMPLEAWAILEDMISVGIPPDRSAFHHVMRSMGAREMRGTWQLLQLMQQCDVWPDAITFDILIARLLHSDNIELALQYLGMMSTRGLTPRMQTIEQIIRCACKQGLPRLALDLARSFEEASVRRFDGSIWMDCLVASAESLWLDGVKTAWQKCVHELNMTPDEGCCIRVLHTAARAADPQLALDVIKTLQSIRIDWQEHHFAPLVEAFSRANELKQAFEVLGTMQKYNVTPNIGTAFPIYRIIAGPSMKLDLAWTAIDELHKEGKTVDVTALNVVLRAAVRLDDLQRALGIYTAYPSFDVKPTIDTYNILLIGCISASHRELGDRLLTELKEAGLKPDAITYERVIALCLRMPTYEDAFFYLEEMKSEGFTPSLTVYTSIIRKCVTNGDPRHRIALEEMIEQGYEVSEKLQAFIDSGGEQPVEDEQPGTGSETFASTRPRRRRVHTGAGSRGYAP